MTSLDEFIRQRCEAAPESRVTFAEFRERFERATSERPSNFALSRALRQHYAIRAGAHNIRFVIGVRFRPTAPIPADQIQYEAGYIYQTERMSFSDLRQKLCESGCDDAQVCEALRALRK